MVRSSPEGFRGQRLIGSNVISSQMASRGIVCEFEVTELDIKQ
jgi:hypothetical protein